MAGKITHAVFANELIKKSKIDNIDNEYIKTYSMLPDFPRTNHLNRKIHRNKINILFTNMFKYIIDNNLENDTEIRSMFFGFVSHYVLDSKIHPYVFYKTEYHDNKYKPSKYCRKHHLYERYIDIYYINKLKIYKFYKYPFNIKISEQVSLLLDEVIDKTFNVSNSSKNFKKGFIGAKIVFKWFKYDKYKIKSIIYKLFPKHYKYLTYNINLNKDKYIMNEEHKVWYNPVNKEKHTESVIDIYKNSINEGIKLFKQIDNCLKQKDINKFSKVIGNNSYVHGLDNDRGYKLKYLDKEL